MKSKILLKKALLIDPSINLKNKADLLLGNGKILKIADFIEPSPDFEIINCEKLLVMPGIIDVHVHTRVPGNEDAEDFKSLTKAALSGGITSILAMPNTSPPIDNASILKQTLKKSKKESPLNIFISATITRKRSGKGISDFPGLKSAGAMAFTDDGSWVENPIIMEKALEYSARLGLPVLSHCQFPYKNKYAPINLGSISRLKKISGIPQESEKMAILRDILLNVKAGGILHLQHISLKDSVELIGLAKKLDINITAETCPHYFWFTEKNLIKLDTNFKMNPPLRTQEDRKAIIKGLREGIIDIISSDHAPHSEKLKSLDIYKAPFGVIGVETLLSASIDMLYHREKLPLSRLVELLSINPSRLLKLRNKGTLKPHADADIAIVDLNKEFKVESFYSQSSNSPFKNIKLRGKNIMTFLSGKKVYENGKFYL